MAEQSSSPPSLFLAHGGIGETSVSYVSKTVVTSSGSGGGGGGGMEIGVGVRVRIHVHDLAILLMGD